MHDRNHLNVKLAVVCLIIVLVSAVASATSKAQDTQTTPATADEQAEQKHTGKPAKSGKPNSQAKTSSARIKKFIPSQQLEADKPISLPANI